MATGESKLEKRECPRDGFVECIFLKKGECRLDPERKCVKEE